jgi:hypothetical protein
MQIHNLVLVCRGFKSCILFGFLDSKVECSHEKDKIEVLV